MIYLMYGWFLVIMEFVIMLGLLNAINLLLFFFNKKKDDKTQRQSSDIKYFIFKFDWYKNLIFRI